MTVETLTLMIRILPSRPPKTYIIIHKKYSIFNNLFLFYVFYKFSIKNRFLYKTVFFLLHLLQVQQHMMMAMTTVNMTFENTDNDSGGGGDSLD